MSCNEMSSAHHGRVLSLWPACAVIVFLTGCGGGGGGGGNEPQQTAPPTTAAPAISVQPADQSVPMGLPATFSVTAAAKDSTGAAAPLQYQWLLKGKPISGATGSTYTTPATSFTDSGSQFTVTVTDAGGSVTSTAASLTITARAPNPKDLRFQQVDSPATVNGYGLNPSDDFNNGSLNFSAYDTYSNVIGLPLELGDTCEVPPDPGFGCAWRYYDFKAPGLAAGYASGAYDIFSSLLQSDTYAEGDTNNPASASAVITSLDLDVPNALYAASWISDPTQSAFTLNKLSVAPADLAATVTQEGQSSRVVTAISYEGDQVTLFSYGWQEDTTTVYETQVSTAAAADVATTAAALAQQGYIITAIGPADAGSDLFLVGTRVAGDTMPRPFMVGTKGFADLDFALEQQGYAIVGLTYDPNNASYGVALLGER